MPTPPPNPPADNPTLDAATRDVPDVLAMLRTTADGLDPEAAADRRADGWNEIASERPPRWYVQFLQAFHVPFNYLLLTLAVIALATDDQRAAVVIAVMVGLSGSLRFWQEYRSGRAAEQLRAMVHTTATVSRPGTPAAEVPIRELVVGDVIHLSAGDLVPADVRVLSAKDLFVTQAALTGESMPVEKADLPAADARRLVAGHAAPVDLPSLCFLGTSVVSGTAKAVVAATGNRTFLGTVARHLVGRRAETAFDKGVRGVSWLLIRFMAVMVPVVVLLNGVTKGDWGEALLFGLAVAVGLTPEMVIVKKLQAIQNLGAMDVLCTDKTGTLTQDKVVLLRHLDVDGNESADVLEYTYLNSYFQTGLKNLLDRAVLDHDDLAGKGGLAARYIKADEVPFDFHRRRMSVVVHEVFRGRDLLICKGAAAEVLAACTDARVGGQPVPLTDAVRDHILKLRTDMNEDGLRVIAVAVKQVLSRSDKQYGVADEVGLTLVGFVAFLDPPKESATPALAALARHGVAVKILTGDNDLVAPEGLPGRRPADAADAARARGRGDDRRRARTGGRGSGPVREAEPVPEGADHRRPEAPRAHGRVPRRRDQRRPGPPRGRRRRVGRHRDRHREGVGRHHPARKEPDGPFLPMLAIHLLIQNLLYDISQVGIPFDRMDADYLETPHKWRVNDLGRFMAVVGPISSVFDVTTFAVLYFVFAADTPAAQALFQSGWFVEGLLSQTLVIHMIRTAKVPFVESTAATPLVLLTGAIMAAGIAVPYTAFGAAVGLVPLPLAYFPWLAGTLAGYCVLTQVVKRWYVRRFGIWL